jgi:hypothetical protein
VGKKPRRARLPINDFHHEGMADTEGSGKVLYKRG